MNFFIPDDIISQLSVLKDCPYCAVYPDNPCILHKERKDYENLSDD